MALVEEGEVDGALGAAAFGGAEGDGHDGDADHERVAEVEGGHGGLYVTLALGLFLVGLDGRNSPY